MKRIKLTVAYDGSNYCGWQVQPNGETIQGLLNWHLSQLLGEEIKTIGASRTDAGVHARGNVAVFDTETKILPEKISYALNARLPQDIRVWESKEVDKSFHPRFAKTVKTYEYCILNRKFADPLHRLYSYFCYVPLDVEKMKEAAAYLEGEHDFKSFCTENPQITSTVRQIYRIEIEKKEDLIRIEICGNGFLYNMIRIIAGTLMEVGRGKIPPEKIKEILSAKDRNLAGPTARACGLTLKEILYPEWEELNN
ncbi:MAG TPA: tRNA pseudouridine(38-40) synthase TruA [Lachnospiraceae bacterium]